MSKAIVPLAEGFEDIEAVTVIDVLRRGGVEVVAAAVGQDIEVTGAHGTRIRADALLSDVFSDAYNAIVLPGGGQGAEILRADEKVLELLRRLNGERALICAICAAPVVLVEAGVLHESQHVTCYPTLVPQLDRPCANVPVVADNNIVTGQGPAAALLFAHVVLSRLAGDAVARKVARGMLFDAYR